MMASIRVVLRLFHFVLFGLLLSSCATNEPFVKEILTAWRAPPPKNKLEVTDIVERYIPIGMALDDALAFFKSKNFKTYPVKGARDRGGYEQVYTCIQTLQSGIFTADQISVVLYANAERVVARKGIVYVDAP